MKKHTLLRPLLVLFLLVSLFWGNFENVYAAATSQDGLVVTLSTNKETYAAKDEITVTLTVENTNSFAVTNVSLQNLIPEGYNLSSGSADRSEIAKIEAGETVTLQTKITQTTQPAQPPAKETEKESEKASEKPESAINEATSSGSSTGTTGDGNSAINEATSSGSSINSNSQNPKTGDTSNIVLWIVIFLLALAACGGLAFYRIKKFGKLFAWFLAILLLGNTLLTPNATASAAGKKESFSAFTAISVEKDKVVLEGVIKYDEIDDTVVEPPVDEGPITLPVDNTVSIDSFSADETDILIGSNQEVTFFAEISSQNTLPADAVSVIADDGQELTKLNDNGQNGDAVAGDGIFSGKASVDKSEIGPMLCHAAYGQEVSKDLELFFYTELTQADFDAAQAIVSAMEEAGDIEPAMAYLATAPDAAEYELSEDGLSIYVRTTSGITIIFDTYTEFAEEEEETEEAETEEEFIEEEPVVEEPIEEEPVEEEPVEEEGTGEPVETSMLPLPTSVTTSFGPNNQNAGFTNPAIPTAEDIENQLNDVTYELASNKTGIGLIQPFRGTEFPWDDILTAGEIIESHTNGTLHSYTDDEATVDVFKHLDENAFNIIFTHGVFADVSNSAWTINSRHPYMLTGETLGSWDSFISADWQSERTVIVAFDGSAFGGFLGGGRVAVGGKFFDHYYEDGSLDGTAILLACCSGMIDDSIADALLSKGAEVVFGYDNSVVVQYHFDVIYEGILNQLLVHHATAKTAYDQARAVCGDFDPYYMEMSNVRTELRMKGDNHYRLVAETGTVSGNVVDYDTSNPIANARISFIENESGRSCNMTTGNDGLFSAKLEEGTYTVNVTAYGYLSESIANVVVTAGQTYYLDTSIMLHPVNNATIQGYVTDAVTGAPIADAKIQFRIGHNNQSGDLLKYDNNKTVVLKTNAYGYYEFDKLPGGYYTVEVSAGGYLKTYRNIVASSTTQNQDVALSPTLDNSELRVVLTWGQNPRDLDSHLVGPKNSGDGNFHVYYSSKVYKDGDNLIADLDLDDTTSYGPETTTLHSTTGGKYYFYVHHFAGTQNIATSGAQVRVYQGDRLINTFNAPTDQGTDIYWNVFVYDSSSQTIIPVNTITSKPVTK